MTRYRSRRSSAACAARCCADSRNSAINASGGLCQMKRFTAGSLLGVYMLAAGRTRVGGNRDARPARALAMRRSMPFGCFAKEAAAGSFRRHGRSIATACWTGQPHNGHPAERSQPRRRTADIGPRPRPACISPVRPSSAVETLRRSNCATITNRSMRDIGILHRGRDTWIVLASPYVVPSRSEAPVLASRTLDLVNQARARGARCGHAGLRLPPP